MPDSIIVHRHARRILHASMTKMVATPRGKSSDDSSDAGELTGYLVVWGNVDQENEVIQKGAFAKSIAQRVAARKVPLMIKHFCNGGDALDCIGTIVEAKEDDYGLWIRAEFSSDSVAQGIRTRIVEGHIKGLSVGYGPVTWEVRTRDSGLPPALVHTECVLFEGTVTVKPVNDQAGIISAKSLSDNPDIKAHAPGNAALAAPAIAKVLPVTIAAQCQQEIREAEMYLSTLSF